MKKDRNDVALVLTSKQREFVRAKAAEKYGGDGNYKLSTWIKTELIDKEMEIDRLNRQRMEDKMCGESVLVHKTGWEPRKTAIEEGFKCGKK